jgi:hypothetical protein
MEIEASDGGRFIREATLDAEEGDGAEAQAGAAGADGAVELEAGAAEAVVALVVAGAMVVALVAGVTGEADIDNLSIAR